MKPTLFPLARRTSYLVLLASLLALIAVSGLEPHRAQGAADPILTHGPVVGAVTSSSAHVFARTSTNARVSIRYATTPDLSDAVESVEQATGPEHDFTTTVPLENLASSTVYYLDILVNGVSQKNVPFPHFKTFPVKGVAQDFSFIVLTDFKSALEPEITPVQTFTQVAAENPDFVILGGDFDHSGPFSRDQKRGMFKNLYTPHNAYVTFPQVLEQFALAHFWDDHDFGPNNADRTYPGKRMARKVLKEYFPVYKMGHGGDYQRFSYAKTDFFLLDSRSQRDPDSTPDGPTKSMLDGTDRGSKGQLSWLLNGLKQSHATWKFILTPVVFNPTHPKLDAWNGFQYERNRIVKFIRDNNIEGVIFLSGDSHFGAIDKGKYSSFPEMLVPPANADGCMTANGTGNWSVGVYATRPCPGYGVIQVTTHPNRVKLMVKDHTGGIRLQSVVKLPKN